jgi:hypothetical protein
MARRQSLTRGDIRWYHFPLPDKRRPVPWGWSLLDGAPIGPAWGGCRTAARAAPGSCLAAPLGLFIVRLGETACHQPP